MRAWPSPSLPDAPGTGPPLWVHDTASGRLQAVTPRDRARMYVCGITPYDATHIGHAATYVTFDLIVRLWHDAGQDVTYVQNVTDVDDPLLERAERDGVDWQDLAARGTELFREDMTALHVLPPDHYMGAVEGIPTDVTAIEKLLADDVAYALPVPEHEGQGYDVYLDLSTQPTFGAVSSWTRKQMMAVYADRGGDPDREGKRDRLDPLLWRGVRAGEPSWAGASLGPGRPGWHIECTTIALEHLGMGFDVQGGGDDLIFPHHEMSAVQAVALDGTAPFAQAYVHQAMVGLDGAKMSKSDGNLVLVSALRREGVDPMAIRLALLSRHYRTAWDWTGELLAESSARLDRWRRACVAVPTGEAGAAAPAAGTRPAHADDVVAAVRRHLADDLDSPGALQVVDRWVDDVLTGPGSGEPARAGRAVAAAVDALLGVRL